MELLFIKFKRYLIEYLLLLLNEHFNTIIEIYI